MLIHSICQGSRLTQVNPNRVSREGSESVNEAVFDGKAGVFTRDMLTGESQSIGAEVM